MGTPQAKFWKLKNRENLNLNFSSTKILHIFAYDKLQEFEANLVKKKLVPYL